MDQHPIPRQITTFEFKLIGFLTIKQFIYLVVFVGLGMAVYGLTPIPVLNVVFGALTSLIGVAFAFIPINDRPMEVWIRNLIKRLTSPTQYGFQKQNKPASFLQNNTGNNTPQQIAIHIDSQQKLNSYLSSKQPSINNNNQKRNINELLTNPLAFLNKKPTSTPSVTQSQSAKSSKPTTNAVKKPFITGVVKNHKLTPLGGVLVYIKKDSETQPVRILKSNLHGIFLSYNPLEPGEYIFEIKDPKQGHFFDTMKVRLNTETNQPIEIHSKELI